MNKKGFELKWVLVVLIVIGIIVILWPLGGWKFFALKPLPQEANVQEVTDLVYQPCDKDPDWTWPGNFELPQQWDGTKLTCKIGHWYLKKVVFNGRRYAMPIVAEYGAELRQLPDDGAVVTAKAGVPLVAVSKSGNWVLVSNPDGSQGWISKRYLYGYRAWTVPELEDAVAVEPAEEASIEVAPVAEIPPAEAPAEPAPEPAEPAEAPAQPETANLEVVTYTPPEGAVPLVDKGETIGFFWVLNQVGPARVKSPYQNTTLFALGNGVVGDTKVSSDGTEGNVVTLLCNEPEGCDTEVKDYTPGHVGITVILAGKEVPAQTALGAVVNLFNAPNCGGSGCKTVHSYQSGKQETFTTKPTAVKLDVPWVSVTVATAIVGEPPANAKVIKIGQKVVGHSYTCSGECNVSVPEGAGGAVACFPEGGSADGEAVDPGKVLSWRGTPSDGNTPEDLNLTVLLSGKDIQITMVYLADLGPFENVTCQ